MVHQIETETADSGENGVSGRIPAGFCTLTCAVYKWQQLHNKTLKSYPSGSQDDPKSREYYQQWVDLSPGPAREAVMKQAFYQLAVANPGAVAWYCGLKLEMAVHLVKQLLTQTMQSRTTPGLEAVKTRLQEELERKLGAEVQVDQILELEDLGCVDDFYASFEWSGGGIVHVHMALWIVGAPRIDKVTLMNS